MSKFLIVAGLLVAFAGEAVAQGRDANEKSLNSELARDRAETRIDRLRQDQRIKEDRAQPRAQKLPAETNTRQQQQPQR